MVTSSASTARALEAACYDQLGLIWLAGGHHPDHNTLWRFVHANRAALQALFRRSVQVAHHCGLVGLVLHAVDGTKIEAACSRRTSWRQAALTKALARLETQIADVLAAMATAPPDEAAALGLPDHLQHAEARRDAIQEALSLLEAAHRTEVHPTEPDAQRMVDGHGHTTLAYNAQAVVDQQSGLLVASDVCTAAADNARLPALLAATAETLGQTAETSVADGGFFSGEALAAVEAAEQTVLVNDRAMTNTEQPYAKARFRYDAERDAYQCPMDQWLPYVSTHQKFGKPYTVRCYRCPVATCPARGQCTTARQGRLIERTPYDDAIERHAARAALPENQALLNQRGRLIERGWAEIKQVQGFRRFTWRGWAGVQGQWALVTLVYNLRKLLTRWRSGDFTWTPGPIAV